MKFIHLVKRIAVVTLCMAAGMAHAQGPLTPPGAPGATYKTLQQVEPRVPINQTDMPMTISLPGSYYLTSNLSLGAGAGHGITIQTGDVVLDLNGFRLQGPDGSPQSQTGVYVASGMELRNIVIRNGTITHWTANGVQLDPPNVKNCRLENLLISKCDANGALINFNTIVSDCVFEANTGRGLYAESNNIVLNCIANTNGGEGFFVGNDGVVSGCVAKGNGASGIWVTLRCSVIQCIAAGNTGDGIRVSSTNNFIRDNQCHANVVAGIQVDSSGNRIEGNLLTSNNRGLDVDTDGNFIVKNSAQGNTGSGAPSANYDLNGTTQTIGPIITATGTISSTNPWANFEY